MRNDWVYKNYYEVNKLGKLLIEAIAFVVELIPTFKLPSFIKTDIDANGNKYASVVYRNVVYSTYVSEGRRHYARTYNVWHPKNKDYEETK